MSCRLPYIPDTWSQEPLFSTISEFRYIVHSLAYEHRLFTRTRRPLLQPVESSLPTCTRGQVLWLEQSNTVHQQTANRRMACLNLRVEKHFDLNPLLVQWACASKYTHNSNYKCTVHLRDYNYLRFACTLLCTLYIYRVHHENDFGWLLYYTIIVARVVQ